MENNKTMKDLTAKETFLWDKVNSRPARNYFKDQEGNFYINADPYGLQMSGKISIISIANNPNYELREFGRLYYNDVKSEIEKL